VSSSQFEFTMETVCNDNDESLAHGHFAEPFAVKLSIQVSSSQFEFTMETVCNDNDESLAHGHFAERFAVKLSSAFC
jgi:hypothetical protein